MLKQHTNIPLEPSMVFQTFHHLFGAAVTAYPRVAVPAVLATNSVDETAPQSPGRWTTWAGRCASLARLPPLTLERLHSHRITPNGSSVSAPIVTAAASEQPPPLSTSPSPPLVTLALAYSVSPSASLAPPMCSIGPGLLLLSPHPPICVFQI